MELIVEKILNEQENFLVTGNNGVGKSFLAYSILENCENFYYIGVINHSFKLRLVKTPIKDEEYEFNIITEERLKTDKVYEAKAYDTYGRYELDSVAIALGIKFMELLSEEKIRKEVEKILSCFNIKLVMENNNLMLEIEGINFYLNDGKDISIGYQTILRIVTELFLLKLKYKRRFVIFLDEVSKSLDCLNSLKLLKVLEEFFPRYKFIITTHSYDLILGTKDSKVIKINTDKVIQYFETKDFKTIEEIREQIFDVVNEEKIDEVEKLLYNIGNIIDNLRNNKITSNYERLEKILKTAELYKEKSNKVKIMYNFGNKILAERKK
ncbi:hypothetical protein [Cetobacterium sp. 2G large]|uniref:hypothetical protein n=1 Tax=Cetobacterium sp. 2G large TaxID=2759680 RepID=UPI00163D3707|nr:hypothetical protein [Cetobacterium sp. 2G large]MBC2854717.1 hypothetical protein [Cetobacterium sp. 2G large]